MPLRMKSNMVTGALMLSAAAIFVRVIGFVFRVYLSNKMGAEGMGVYMLIISMYNFCVTLATAGMSVTVSTLTAEQLSLGNPSNARRVLGRAITLSVIISGAVCGGVIAFAEPVGNFILKDARTVMSLRILAAGIPFLSVSACMRGYFIASRRAGNPAVGQVLEQLVKMAFITATLGYFLPRGVDYACAIVVAGITIGEIVCFLYSFWGYARAKKRTKNPVKADITGVTVKIASMASPLAFTAYVRSALRLAEEVLILAGLKAFSGQADTATSAYGMLKGMVMPLLLFPLQLLSSFVITLTPEISRMNAAQSAKRLEGAISRILGYTFIAGIFVVAVFMSFPNKLGTAVYMDERVGEMLGLLSVLCPFMCVEMVVVGILNGLGEQVSSMKYALADSVIRIAMIYFMIPVSGMTGFMIMMAVSNVFTSVFNLIRLLRITGMRFRLLEWIIKPGLAAAAAGQFALFVSRLAFFAALSPRFGLAVLIALAGIVYTFALFGIGSVKISDFTWITDRLRSSPKTPEAAPESAV